jgi:hypothetical protein
MSVGSILILLNELENNAMRKSSMNLVNKKFPVYNVFDGRLILKRYHLT